MMNDLDFNLADKQSYDGELGAVYSPEKTIFRVWQPFAESAAVRVYDGGGLLESVSMKRVGGIFECVKRGNCAGLEYTFLITRNGKTVESSDPYSRAVTADAERSMIVDMNANKPENWDEQPMICAENPVIYELSVRDFSMDESARFSSRGKFAAFGESGVVNSHGDIVGLDYIKSLGVTHIQLMPVFDFDLDGAEYNWGYNPRFYNAPSVGYACESAVFELRELIAAAHKKGLGVVADVVYNHLYSAENSAFGRIFPHYYFRGKVEYSNGSGCGNEFASERKMARKFIVDSLEFLAREYKLDGFRFDLMGLLDIKTLKKAERRLRAVNPNILLYGEGWTGGASALTERRRAVQRNAARLPGFAFFNDSFRDAVKGSVFNAGDCGYVNGAHDEYHLMPIKRALTGEYADCDFWTNSAAQTVNYVECHDNLTLFDKLTASMKGSDKARITAAGRMAAALTLLSRGIAFIQAGQEFLRTKNGEHNSYNLPDSVNSLKWDSVSENRSEVEYYRGLIALRKRLLGGLTECEFLELGGGFTIKYAHDEDEFILLVNPTVDPLIFNQNGEFDIYADSERASDKPLYTSESLCCKAHSILLAGRKI